MKNKNHVIVFLAIFAIIFMFGYLQASGLSDLTAVDAGFAH